MSKKLNHPYPLNTFYGDMEVFKKYGFKPIGFSQMYLETTYIFETEEEANKAYNELEVDRGLVCGWFYSDIDFKKEKEKYEQEKHNTIVNVFYLYDEELNEKITESGRDMLYEVSSNFKVYEMLENITIKEASSLISELNSRYKPKYDGISISESEDGKISYRFVRITNDDDVQQIKEKNEAFISSDNVVKTILTILNF